MATNVLHEMAHVFEGVRAHAALEFGVFVAGEGTVGVFENLGFLRKKRNGILRLRG